MATAIAEGDRTVRVDASSIRELATLTTTLNGMTDRLQEYEHQLATKNRLAALGELAERVAHEIRNPITAIKLHMQILAERLAGSDLQQTPNQLLIEIARLEMVVSNTLALGKPMSIQRDWVQVEQVLTDVVMLMQPSISHRGIALQWQQPGALPAVALDADRFKQVVYNLLTNAADALDGRGVVRITAIHNQLENVLEIRFEDSGPGFSAAAISNLERRLSQSTKPNGSGVGLLLSLELVELHGGTLTIGTSETLTGGLVVVKLPLIAADEDIQLPVAARPS
jgi:signal transduction histidine kinase